MTHHFDSQPLSPARQRMILEVKQQHKERAEKELSFQRRVDLIATWLESDIAAARRDMNFALRVEMAHRIHWRDCQPESIKTEVIRYYAAKQAARPAAFSYHGSVPTRNGRRGTILRRLTDGRYVVKIDCPLLMWEIYTEAELKALVGKAAGVKAAA